MKNLIELSKTAEKYFHELSTCGDKAKQSYQYILESMDNFLFQQDIPALLELISYIEEGEGYLALQHIGKTTKFLRILHIIELEQKFHQPLFTKDCTNTKMLLEKYMTILFALRRFEFYLSEDSINEAIDYLRTRKVSPFSIHTLIKTENIVTNQTFYELILYTYQSLWNDEEQTLFLSLANGECL